MKYPLTCLLICMNTQHIISQFIICSFRIINEEDCLVQLQEAIFQYIVTKEGKTEELDLPSLASFISASTLMINVSRAKWCT